ncbi:MAG: co-chaperone GroES [Clostridiales bacterium]|jgi:chaperonin GroES|nr:co-chaperone GroES [Clostridiales bacterium]
MNIRPLGDRVVLKQFEAEEKTKSGIILTAKNQEKPSIFEVVVVGDGKMADGTEVDMILKVGEKVICNKFSGLSTKIDEDEFVIIRQGEILAVVD